MTTRTTLPIQTVWSHRVAVAALGTRSAGPGLAFDFFWDAFALPGVGAIFDGFDAHLDPKVVDSEKDHKSKPFPVAHPMYNKPD
jgi:hypothetical protein